MKKLILILTLIFALAICFVACEDLGNTSNEGQSQNVLLNGAPETEEPTTEESTSEEPTSEEPTSEEPTSEEPTSEEATSEEPTTNIAQERVPEFENEGLISTLVEYLQNIFTAYDMPPTSFAIKIDDIKKGDQPLLVQFNPKEYYFVCGYYNATHKYSEYEDREFCCVTEYTWVKFENETDIQEYYSGKKFIVAFQINKSLLVKDILSDESTVPHMEHFQKYETLFENGKNVNASIDFDKTFIYLNSSNKSEIYHSVNIFNHEWITLPCVEVEGELYITHKTHTVRENGNTTYVDLKEKFGEYYDALIEIMKTDKYSNTDKNGKTSHYGLFNIEEFVMAILNKGVLVCKRVNLKF